MLAYLHFSDVQFNTAYLLKFRSKTLSPHSFGLSAFTGPLTFFKHKAIHKPGPNTTAGCFGCCISTGGMLLTHVWQVSRVTCTSYFYLHPSLGLSFSYSLAFQVNSFVSSFLIVCEITLQVWCCCKL